MPSIHFRRFREQQKPLGLCVLLAYFSAITPRAHGAEDLQTPNESEAVATGRPSTAKEWSDHGLLQYRNGDWAAAIEAFRTSYDLSKNPGLLFNIGQALRLSGDCAGAIGAYQRYIDEAPDGRYRAHAQKHLQDLDGCRSPGPAQDTAEPVSSARTVPAANASGTPIGAFAGSKSADVGIPLHPPSEQPELRRKRALVYSLAGVAGLLSAGAAFLTWRAHENSAELSNRYRADGVVWNADASEAEATIERQRTSSVVLVSAAIVSAVAAVSLGMYWHRTSSALPTRQISLELTPGGSALTYARSF